MAGSGGDMFDGVEAMIKRALADAVGPPRSEAGPMTLLPVSHWSGAASGATFLVFTGRAVRPSLIAKFSLERERRAALRRESSNLRKLAEDGPPGFDTTVPGVVRIVDDREKTLLLLTALQGRPMKTRDPGRLLSGRAAHRTLSAVAAWLEAFRTAAGGDGPLDDPQVERLAEGPVAEYLHAFETGPAERELLARARTRARSWVDRGVPAVISHDDFCPSNIIWDDGRVRVIDFEGPFHADLPCYDLLHFLASCAVNFHPSRGRSRMDRFSNTFFRPTALAKAGAARLCILGRSQRVDREDLVASFVLMLVRSALERLRFAQRATGISDMEEALARAYKPGSGLFGSVTIEKRRCLELGFAAHHREALLLGALDHDLPAPSSP